MQLSLLKSDQMVLLNLLEKDDNFILQLKYHSIQAPIHQQKLNIPLMGHLRILLLMNIHLLQTKQTITNQEFISRIFIYSQQIWFIRIYNHLIKYILSICIQFFTCT
ncbi:unnamed protein product [Paramecium sonneborni]|uniref:Uncharacterized protein n=1 Tax=Paramecium sonneborni TaxID=65129 RepID=A0A8S1JVA7_9CILI|nr:unnamed protein product [Paramecium sonneborni]